MEVEGLVEEEGREIAVRMIGYERSGEVYFTNLVL